MTDKQFNEITGLLWFLIGMLCLVTANLQHEKEWRAVYNVASMVAYTRSMIRVWKS